MMQFKGQRWPKTAASSLVKATISIAHGYTSSTRWQDAIQRWGSEHPRSCMHLSRQDGEKRKPAALGIPAFAQVGSRIQGLSKLPPSLAKPPPRFNCLGGSSLCTPVRPTAWPTPQSPALCSASDLNSGCSMNSWETQGVTSWMNYCETIQLACF